MPPRPGRPPQRPSPRQVTRRRTVALALLVLALGGVGWAAVSAIGGSSSKHTPTVSTNSSLIYTTETITTNGKTTQTVIAMPKPFRIVFPEGFTIKQMAARAAAVGRIAEAERGVRTRLSKRGYLAAVRHSDGPTCFHRRSHDLEGFLFPATYDFFAQTNNRQLVQQQLDAFCENWQRVDLSYARSKKLTPYDVLIIASMVEKETLSPDERPLVAGWLRSRYSCLCSAGSAGLP